MKIDEIKIQKLISQFKNSKDQQILIEIIKELSIMIYNYPKLLYNYNEDNCSDFYLYFIERIESVILKYNENMASFNTYFNIVLKSRYINWLNQIKTKNRIQDYPVSFENLNSARFQNYDGCLNESDLKNKIEEVIKKMPVLDYLIIKLCYYHIDAQTLNILAEYLKKPLKECYNLYQEAFEKSSYTEKFNKLYTKLENLNIKLNYLEQNLKVAKNQEKLHLNSLKSKIEKKIKETQNALLELKIIEIKFIKKILNISLSDIYYRLDRIKKVLKEELKDL